MTNNLSEKRSNRGILAALVSAFIFALAALVTGLALGIQNNMRDRGSVRSINTPHYLLVDSAESLNHALSAMRLCNGEDAARELASSALIYAVRAETALECENFDYMQERDSEAFLNDLTATLGAPDVKETMNNADKAYGYSKAFLEHVKNGGAFEYDGGLDKGAAAMQKRTRSGGEVTPDDKTTAAGAELIKSKLDVGEVEFVGGYEDRLEYSVERDGVIGYAVTEKNKIAEFAFSHGDSSKNNVSEDDAQRIAMDCVKTCGYDDLEVFNTEINGGTATVRLCKAFKGAKACDDCASVIVANGKAVAFSSGKCGTDHDVPQVKVDEKYAAKNAPKGARATGVLVTRKVNGKERVCYQYVYDLDDGVHYVYVCAESGEQMQVS